MKKLYAGCVCFIALFFIAEAFGQIKIDNPYRPAGYKYNVEGLNNEGDQCGFLGRMQMQEQRGYYRQGVDSIINTLIARDKQRSGNPSFTMTDYVIPVIFHIIHEPGEAPGTGDNISQARINAQIEELNRNFANLTGSNWPQAADARIQFCAVKVDMNGNPLAEPGIERIDRVAMGFTDFRTFTINMRLIGYVDSVVKPVTYWDPSRVLNIWTLPTFQTQGLGGYATYPDLFPLYGMPDTEIEHESGCVVNSGFVGGPSAVGTGDSRFIYGRNTTHEVAHYLGLIHTWGDRSDCTGTDYCDDTPPCRSAYNSAMPTCPQGPVGARCGSNPRMISNYLDYSVDLCRNTFTQNQVERMQIVMQYAPNRPREVYPYDCTAPVANSIGFSKGSGALKEGTDVCGSFTDHTITIRPAGAATGNAVVTATFGGTATQGSDYEVLGATQFAYNAGNSSEHSFTIRVYDDNVKEADETVEINLNIAGSGLAPGTINQTYKLLIVDDDIRFEADALSPQRLIYAQNFDTVATGYLPQYWLQGAMPGNATSNVFTINTVYGSSGFSAADGKVLHITNSNANLQLAGTAVNDYTKTARSHYVVVTDDIDTRGYHNLKLKFYYASMGEGTDSTGDIGYVGYTTTSQYNEITVLPDVLSNTATKTSLEIGLPDSLANKEKVYIVFGWMNNNNGTGNPVPLTVDNIQLFGDVAGIETALNTRAAKVNGTDSLQFVDDAHKLIALVHNLNEQVGCLDAAVTQAGTGRVPVQTNAGTYYRTEKVISLSPQAPNSTASYTITLYYTTAELAAWPAPLSLNVAKVDDGVSLNSILTPANTTIYIPQVADLRATKGYVAYSVDVTDGFSQFFLVDNDLVMPVSLLQFTAKPRQASIMLNWKTGAEINNKGFFIMRGNTPQNLEQISFVAAKPAAVNGASYAFEDMNVLTGVDYYYRLKQVDNDGRSSLSPIRKASIGKASNPFTAVVAVGELFIYSTVSGNAAMQLFASDGRMLFRSSQVLKPVQSIHVPLAAGVYILQILHGGQLYNQKILIR